MRTEEDEAFDDLARKQGMWGGGFPAKRQAAMDKIHAEFYEKYVRYRTAFPKEYTAPQREWVGLTDEEIKHIEETTTCLENESWLRNLTQAIEAKLKEKNNG